MTNPNNAVGTNGAFGGRTSVNAFNDIMGAFQSRGVLSGWGISPSSGMTVSVGGNGTTRDVAVAEDASGNKTSVNNISGAPILVTLDSAPASNSRYDAIVAYVDKPPVGNATQDNPECCGIISVTGTAASSPAYPSGATIRSAITADGASGATAYYAILGYVLVASGTTSITSGMITGAGNPMLNGIVGTSQIQNGAVTSDKIDSTTLGTDSRSAWLVTDETFTSSGYVNQTPTVSINTNGGDILCIATIVGQATAGSGALRVYRDNGADSFRVGTLTIAHGLEKCVGSYIFKSVASGTHTFRFYVSLDGSGSSITVKNLYQYSLTVVELPQKVLK
jgi:hypothetical protein